MNAWCEDECTNIAGVANEFRQTSLCLQSENLSTNYSYYCVVMHQGASGTPTPACCCVCTGVVRSAMHGLP